MNRSKNVSQGLQIMLAYRQNCDCVIEKITSFFFSLSSFTFKFKIDNKKVAKLRNLTAFLVKTAVLSVLPYICINETFFLAIFYSLYALCSLSSCIPQLIRLRNPSYTFFLLISWLLLKLRSLKAKLIHDFK